MSLCPSTSTLMAGRPVAELSLTKSGLLAPFGSKRDRQPEPIEAARQIIMQEIVQPAMANPEGMPQLWALCDGWLSHLDRCLFIGGSPFSAPASHLDSPA